jgi:hypothetical protein
MFKRMFCLFTLVGMLYLASGCEKDEIQTHRHVEVGPTVIQQDTIVE